MKIWFLILTIFFIGCSKNGNSGSQSNTTSSVVFLKDLSDVERSELSYESCSTAPQLNKDLNSDTEDEAEDPEDKCVVICHVPPGHPENKKSKTVGVSALQAHIDHGCEKNPSKDYIGPCREDDDLGDDSSHEGEDSSL